MNTSEVFEFLKNNPNDFFCCFRGQDKNSLKIERFQDAPINHFNLLDIVPEQNDDLTIFNQIPGGAFKVFEVSIRDYTEEYNLFVGALHRYTENDEMVIITNTKNILQKTFVLNRYNVAFHVNSEEFDDLKRKHTENGLGAIKANFVVYGNFASKASRITPNVHQTKLGVAIK